MRKFILVLAMTFCVALMYGQTKQGVFFMSGATDLSFSSMKTKLIYDGQIAEGDLTTSSFSLTPSMGYFFNDNWVMGLSINYENEKQIYENESESISTSMVGPFVRGYLSEGNVKPFVQGDLMFGKMKAGDSSIDMEGWDLGVGIAAFVGNNVSFDFGLGYGKVKNTSSEDSDLKLENSGVIFNIGISVYL